MAFNNAVRKMDASAQQRVMARAFSKAMPLRLIRKAVVPAFAVGLAFGGCRNENQQEYKFEALERSFDGGRANDPATYVFNKKAIYANPELWRDITELSNSTSKLKCEIKIGEKKLETFQLESEYAAAQGSGTKLDSLNSVVDSAKNALNRLRGQLVAKKEKLEEKVWQMQEKSIDANTFVENNGGNISIIAIFCAIMGAAHLFVYGIDKTNPNYEERKAREKAEKQRGNFERKEKRLRAEAEKANANLKEFERNN